ncbi:hypothetical protein [Streptomyces sp. KL116D]|uniref:hypothetical protein n=1 Tax=Streptomyces sp. KL116D TaxID=3045152 RepID=UPI003556AD90
MAAVVAVDPEGLRVGEPGRTAAGRRHADQDRALRVDGLPADLDGPRVRRLVISMGAM